MGDDGRVFRDAKEAFRAQHADVEALDQALQRPLQQLGLCDGVRQPRSVDTQADIRRFWPSLQQSLLEHVVPTWLPTLQERPACLSHLQAYFYPVLPSNPSQQLLSTAIQVALSSYLTLVPFLTSPACPPQSRQFVLSALATLSAAYPIDSMYWAIWGSQVSSRDSQAELKWEEVIKILVGLPSKVANSVGARNQELSAGEEVPRPLFPRYVMAGHTTDCSVPTSIHFSNGWRDFCTSSALTVPKVGISCALLTNQTGRSRRFERFW